jgi:hypothetical protein
LERIGCSSGCTRCWVLWSSLSLHTSLLMWSLWRPLFRRRLQPQPVL